MKKKMFLRFDADINDIQAGAGEGSIEVHAQKTDDDGKKKLATFTIKAFNGDKMNVGFGNPVVLDLAGMSVTAKGRPILLNHNLETPVGHSTDVKIGARSIVVKGVFSVQNERTEEMINSDANGFPWQASVGVDVEEIEFVAEGEKVKANGRTFKGPVLVATKSRLKETSFVPLGADDSTSAKISAKIAASVSAGKGMENSMEEFLIWLAAGGHDVNNLAPAVKAALRKTFDAQQLEAKENEKTKLEAAAKKKLEDDEKEKLKATGAPAAGGTEALETKLEAMGKAYADGLIRKNEIASVCAKHPEIMKLALAQNWDLPRTQDAVDLKDIRAERENGSFNINTGAGAPAAVTEAVLKAAVLQTGKTKEADIIAEHGQESLEAADKAYSGNIGLQQLILITARANGMSQHHHAINSGNLRSILEATFRPNMQAAFSTLSLPGILSNVANKSFVDNFMFQEQVWRMVSAIGSTKDFKQMTKYSLDGDMEFIKVAPGGKIEHGTTGETEYTNQADTYARMYSITRTDIINDDLGALTTVPARLGRGAGINFNKAFWTEFLENALPFYSSDNKNLQTGASSALGIDSLTSAVALFRTQTDPNDNLYGASPKLLLTPPALEVTGRQLNTDSKVLIDSFTEGDDVKIPDGNPHKGLYSPITSAYLQDTNITNNSATAWFLLSDPAQSIQSVIEAIFLNGQENPTIESADADFNTLGIQMRGFFDWGVNKQEFREGNKSNGV